MSQNNQHVTHDMFTENRSFTARYTKALSQTKLTPVEATVITEQYIPATEDLIAEHWWACVTYNILMIVGLISSVCVTALISIHQLAGISDDAQNAVFWLSLAMSLVSTVTMKLIYTTGVYKQYILGASASAQLQSEGWKYVARAGKYSVAPNSHERFRMFADTFTGIIANASTGMALAADGQGVGGDFKDALGGAPPDLSDEVVDIPAPSAKLQL